MNLSRHCNTIFIFFAFATLLFLGCGPRLPQGRPEAGNCEITFNHFLDGCYTTLYGTTFIEYDLHIDTWYDDPNSGRTHFASANYSSTSSSVKQPITVQVEIPKTGFYFIETTITGRDCSMCASGWGGTNNNGTDNCPPRNEPNGPGRVAAIPRWYADMHFDSYQSTVTVDPFTHYFNVDNSCGCIVNP